MFASSDVAAVLGLPARSVEAHSPVMLIVRNEHGLPVKALDKVAHLLAPDDAKFKYRLIPKGTLERRRTTKKLSPEEGLDWLVSPGRGARRATYGAATMRRGTSCFVPTRWRRTNGPSTW